ARAAGDRRSETGAGWCRTGTAGPDLHDNVREECLMTADSAIGTRVAAGTRVQVHPLTYVDEGDEVMIGRPDTGSYGVFPRAGAELLRSLESGATLESCAQRWHDRTGETLDVTDFLGILDDLGFVVGENDVRTDPSPVRWQRLARLLFSPPV